MRLRQLDLRSQQWSEPIPDCARSGPIPEHRIAGASLEQPPHCTAARRIERRRRTGILRLGLVFDRLDILRKVLPRERLHALAKLTIGEAANDDETIAPEAV
jgi:hypothetical protein